MELRSKFIEVDITQDMIDKAQQKIDKINFDVNKGLSKFGSEQSRTLVGYLGEQMVASHLKIAIDVDGYDYDLMYKNFKVEVKTISCKFMPLPHYLCIVNSHNLEGVHKQRADYYIFTRILNDKSKGWILGNIKCKDFFEGGTFVPKGTEVIKDVDFSKANATTLEIFKLNPMKR